MISVTEAAVLYLQTTLEIIKPTVYEGENVSRVLSLVIGAHKRFLAVHKIADELPEQLVGIFQTSSVKAFNAKF